MFNELKTLTKHISSECTCKFHGKKCNSNQRWNNNKCWCQCQNPKNHHIFENVSWIYFSPGTCICQNDKYL